MTGHAARAGCIQFRDAWRFFVHSHLPRLQVRAVVGGGRARRRVRASSGAHARGRRGRRAAPRRSATVESSAERPSLRNRDRGASPTLNSRSHARNTELSQLTAGECPSWHSSCIEFRLTPGGGRSCPRSVQLARYVPPKDSASRVGKLYLTVGSTHPEQTTRISQMSEGGLLRTT